jgi:uncharacterized protein (DUF427 family)
MKLPHRIQVSPAPGTVTVRAGDVVLATSGRALELREGGLPPRYYLPPEDVRMDLLEPTDSSSRCPWKGNARYWSARVGADTLEDVAWAYDDPLDDVAQIARHIAFYDDRVELTVA